MLNDAFYVFLYSMPPEPSLRMNHLHRNIEDIFDFLALYRQAKFFFPVFLFLPLQRTEHLPYIKGLCVVRSSGAEC